MRPSTEVYCFIDDVPATNLCLPAANNSVGYVYENYFSGNVTYLTTDTKGDFYCGLQIPAGVFFFGANLYIQFCDSQNITDTQGITTMACASYFETALG